MLDHGGHMEQSRACHKRRRGTKISDIHSLSLLVRSNEGGQLATSGSGV